MLPGVGRTTHLGNKPRLELYYELLGCTALVVADSVFIRSLYSNTDLLELPT